MAITPIKGLFEAHLIVKDLNVSTAFYRDVLGLPLAHVVPSRNAAFFWVPTPEKGMLGLWSIYSSPIHMRLHLAFAVDLPQVESSVAALRAAGMSPHDGDGAAIEEPIVLCWMPAASVYFQDPDGHCLEFIAMLPDAPQPDLGRTPLSEWRVRTHDLSSAPLSLT